MAEAPEKNNQNVDLKLKRYFFKPHTPNQTPRGELEEANKPVSEGDFEWGSKREQAERKIARLETQLVLQKLELINLGTNDGDETLRKLGEDIQAAFDKAMPLGALTNTDASKYRTFIEQKAIPYIANRLRMLSNSPAITLTRNEKEFIASTCPNVFGYADANHIDTKDINPLWNSLVTKIRENENKKNEDEQKRELRIPNGPDTIKI